MEENYEESELSYRSLLENAPDALVLVSLSGEIQYVNAQAERLFGYLAAELIGQAVEVLVPERYRAVHQKHRATYALNPKARPMGLHIDHLAGRRQDGTEFLAEINLSPMPGGATVVAVRVRENVVTREREWQAGERERKWLLEQGRQSERERERELRDRRPMVTKAVSIVIAAQIVFNLILYFLLAKQ
jgi:protein-histidine pros-kinase